MSYLNFASDGLNRKKLVTSFRDYKLLKGNNNILWRNIYSNNEIEYNKHGISQKHIPRSGGMLIIFFLIIHLLISENIQVISFDYVNTNSYLIIFCLIALIGIADDVLGGVNYSYKLLNFFVLILLLLLNNEIFVYKNSGLFILDQILNNYFISLIVSLIIIVGFINATNIADGANGIISGIAVISFSIFYINSEIFIFYVITKFLIVFFLYNILTGKIFLGDTGSYFLGFLLSSFGLYYFNLDAFSAGFLACLFSYPSIEILVSISRRIYMKINPLQPDNLHLHNVLNAYIYKKTSKPLFSNSMSGLIILIIFCFPTLVFHYITDYTSGLYYWYLFIMIFIVYLSLYYILIRLNKSPITI